MAYTTINKSTDYFNTNLYVGNGTNAHAITGVGFQPDFVWLKNRDGANGHQAFDSIRGATKALFVNETSAEGTYSTTLQSFNSDGFTVGTSSGANTNAHKFASWNWKANGSGSTNYNGSINSTVSANTTAGFSIVTYTGTGSAASFGHGLTSPKIIIIKDRDNSNGWYFHTTAIDGSDDYLFLNQTTAKTNAGAGYSIGTSVYNLGGGGSVSNLSGTNYVAYCFAEKKGYSKFGSYTGNGSTDGTFVYTGFKPAWVMIKRTDTSGNSWFMWDNKRATHNEMVNCLLANTYDAELTDREIDFLSNGFKTRATDGNYNSSGGSYIYMAFASAPLVGTNNIPATAR
jgi:hypothetical protein